MGGACCTSCATGAPCESECEPGTVSVMALPMQESAQSSAYLSDMLMPSDPQAAQWGAYTQHYSSPAIQNATAVSRDAVGEVLFTTPQGARSRVRPSQRGAFRPRTFWRRG